MKLLKLDYIAELCQGIIVNDDNDLIITGINTMDNADANEISFLHNSKYFKKIKTTKAGCVIVPETFDTDIKIPMIKCKDPYATFVKVLQYFHPDKRRVKLGIVNNVQIGKNTTIQDDPAISFNVVIGENVQIGKNVQIGANTVIDDNVTIGDDVLIYANCSLREDTVIGNRVIIQNGAVIGSDGFGFSPQNNQYEKIPQVGKVIIEDDVEIGANTVIDRSTMGVTIIRRGTKLDNLIQIGHNVEVGANTVIAAQSGISGSTKIGENCMIGGQVGFAGHQKIGKGCMFGAQSGVVGDHKENSVLVGSPARPLKKMRYIEASLHRVPELVRKVRDLEKYLNGDKESELG